MYFLILFFFYLVNTQDNCDTTWKDTPEATYLWELVSQGDLHLLRQAIETDHCKAHLRTKDGRGPLFWAYEFDEEDIVEYLLEVGVEMEVKDKHGKTPFDLQGTGTRQPVQQEEMNIPNFVDPPNFVNYDDDNDDEEDDFEEEEVLLDLDASILNNFVGFKNRLRKLRKELSPSRLNDVEVNNPDFEKYVKSGGKFEVEFSREEFSWRNGGLQNTLNGALLAFIRRDSAAIQQLLDMDIEEMSKNGVLEFSVKSALSGEDEKISCEFSALSYLGVLYKELDSEARKWLTSLVELATVSEIEQGYVIADHDYTLFQGAYLDMSEELVELLVRKGAIVDRPFVNGKGMMELNSGVHEGLRDKTREWKAQKKKMDAELARLVVEEEEDEDYDIFGDL